MHFNDPFPDYERMAHHSEEEGVVKRKKLWKVFWIMLMITIIELVVGFYAKEMGLLNERNKSGISLKVIFIGFTILKAAYIVLSFMHLGDERKALKYTILAPYCAFVVYLIWIVAQEGTYAGDPTRKSEMDKNIGIQQEQLLKGGHGGGEHGGSEHSGEEGKETHH